MDEARHARSLCCPHNQPRARNIVMQKIRPPPPRRGERSAVNDRITAPEYLLQLACIMDVTPGEDSALRKGGRT